MLCVATQLLALAALAFASPMEASGQSATLNQVAVQHSSVPQSPAARMLKTYNKYAQHGAKAPAALIDAAHQQHGSVAATPYFDQAYHLIPLTIGNQHFNLELDTGSADLTIDSTLLPSSLRGNLTLYNPTKSPTAKLVPNETWALSDSNVTYTTGVVYTDQVKVGGVTAPSQPVVAVNKIPSFASSQPRYGNFGLAFQSLSNVGPKTVKTFFETVLPTLKQKVFTVDLKRQAPGTVDFGIIDSSKYTGEITYAPVNSSTGLWSFTPQGYKVGSNSTTLQATPDQAEIMVDTASPFSYLSANVVNAYYALAPGANYTDNYAWFVPCSATNLPDFHFLVNDQQLTIPGRNMVSQKWPTRGPNTCIGAIQVATDMPSLIGESMLTSVFAVFDQSEAQPRLGFASKNLGK